MKIGKYIWDGPERNIPGKGTFVKGRVFPDGFFTDQQFKTFRKNRWIKILNKKEK